MCTPRRRLVGRERVGEINGRLAFAGTQVGLVRSRPRSLHGRLIHGDPFPLCDVQVRCRRPTQNDRDRLVFLFSWSAKLKRFFFLRAARVLDAFVFAVQLGFIYKGDLMVV